MENKNSPGCDLCGLPLRFGDHILDTDARSYRFCCMGCKQVFRMLMEATDSPDPSTFKQTDLYRRCLEAGIIPRDEDDLVRMAGGNPSQTSSNTTAASGLAESTSGIAQSPLADENSLTLALSIQDMWCSACAWVIDETLLKMPGVTASQCNFSTDRLHCRYDPLQTTPDTITGAIRRLGYRAAPPDELQLAADKRSETMRFAVSAFLTMNIMMLSVSLYFGFFTELTEDAIWKLSWPIFFMATAVMIYGGYNIFKRSLAGFASAAASMETLIAVGSASAYLFSVYHLLQGSIHLYFDTAAMLITLVLLGKIIERAAKDKVQQDLESFFSLKPTKVKLCTPQFPSGRYVAVENLHKGDIFVVEEDEIVPADGLILEGAAAVDESSLTGEPLPIAKKAGLRIKSGTSLQKGRLTIKAEAVGDNATLGQMIRIMETALSRKTRLEGKTDRWLRWFVPAILGLGATTGLFLRSVGLSTEDALIRAVTVVVISCPCALGVAIPLARVAGISLAGRMGILVRSFSAFERLGVVNSVVFDKTGTLTKGQWQLQRIDTASPISEEMALALAAGLERTADHFIASEIRRQAKRRQIQPLNVTGIDVQPNGVSGRLDRQLARIGSFEFVTAGGMDHKHDPDRLQKSDPGESVVALGRDNQIEAVLVFADELKADAASTVSALKEHGYSVGLVSGDGRQSTEFVGQAVGITASYGRLSPEDKAGVVARLQSKGAKVAVVGDGVNDAPALATADLAVAVHSGSHLGKEVADLTLMRGNPGQLIDFIVLARKTNHKIIQNLAFAFLYNIIAIPLAMAGLLTPILAVCAMLLSSLTVTGNSLLLAKTNQNAFNPSIYALK